MIRYFLFFSLMNSSLLYAEYLELPRSLAYRPVYYVKANQLDEFCCGYNALYNACNLEKISGFANRYSDYKLFKNECMGYLRQKKIDPKNGVYDGTLKALANKLSMKPLRFICFNEEGRIEVHNCEKLHIRCSEYAPQREKDLLFKQEQVRQSKEMLRSIKNKLDNCTSQCEIVHFICHVVVDNRSHSFLISLVHTRMGRALYIFDNLNTPIRERSQAKQYVDFLCEAFNIGSKTQFKPFSLPDIWPTCPKREKKIVYYRYFSDVLYPMNWVASKLL